MQTDCIVITIPARECYTSLLLMANRWRGAGHRARLVGLDSCPKRKVMDVSSIL